MKLSIIIENGEISVLYDGYNIISEIIYDEEKAQQIIDLIQAEFDRPLEEIIKLK